MTKLKIFCAQQNPIMGDIDGNLEIALKAYDEAIAQNCDLLVFSELFIIGYPPEDLVLKPAAVLDCKVAIENLAAKTKDKGAIIIGLPWLENGNLYNAVALLEGGKISQLRFKHELPNYDVFDEKRVFVSGDNSLPIEYNGIKIGLPICEDIWFEKTCAAQKSNGAEFYIVINGSPYRRGVNEKRINVAKQRVRENSLPMIYVNQLGGQDELCFDGASFGLDKNGEIKFQMANFIAQNAIAQLEKNNDEWQFINSSIDELQNGLAADYSAMVLALRDYVNKNRFPGVILGLSGGIDSAISAAIAVDALGKERVICVMMPSKFTSSESLEDAKACIDALGARYEIISIEKMVDEFENALMPQFEGRARDTTEENIQSRARAVVLMALSNKFGHMVLTTGNKSEMAVGYATLYGDICGGYNCLKDIYKTEVFELCKWRNENQPKIAMGHGGIVIPQNIIDKPPSAELRENQKDQDSLPPYDALDDILYNLIEKEEEIEDIISRGHAPETVKRIQNLLYIAEYKRRQAPPGVKIGTKNFGRDRRYPITNKYRDR